MTPLEAKPETAQEEWVEIGALCASPEWSVTYDAGKPILRHKRGGNIARGYIATGQEFDLIAQLLNAHFGGQS